MQNKQHPLSADERLLVENNWTAYLTTVATIAKLKGIQGSVQLSDDHACLIEVPR
jgi:hypothetical protein